MMETCRFFPFSFGPMIFLGLEVSLGIWDASFYIYISKMVMDAGEAT